MKEAVCMDSFTNTKMKGAICPASWLHSITSLETSFQHNIRLASSLSDQNHACSPHSWSIAASPITQRKPLYHHLTELGLHKSVASFEWWEWWLLNPSRTYGVQRGAQALHQHHPPKCPQCNGLLVCTAGIAASMATGQCGIHHQHPLIGHRSSKQGNTDTAL